MPPTLALGLNAWAIFGSLAFVIACSAGVLLFRNRVLSLSRVELRFTAATHLARILIGLGLSALMWHLALPGIALGWWVVLATWRQLVSRLPLLPNKDVMFAALAVVLVGEQNGIAALMALDRRPVAGGRHPGRDRPEHRAIRAGSRVRTGTPTCWPMAS